MLLVKGKSSPLLGSITLLLGLGGSFHLTPGAISHVMLDSFDLSQGALFLGTRISALVMSVFYLLLYAYIHKEGSHTKKNWWSLSILTYGYFLARVVAVFLSFKRSQTMDLISDIPFVLMGPMDFTLLWKERDRPPFSYLAIYIFFNSLFCTPIVPFKNTYPFTGMSVAPKTTMYVLVIIKLYRNIKKDFMEKDMVDFAVTYLFLGVSAGVLCRELGKIYLLSLYFARLRTHLTILDFLVLSIFYLLFRDKGLDKGSLEKFIEISNFGIYLNFSPLFLYGLVGPCNPALLIKTCLAVTGGLGHILLTSGAVFFSLKALRALEERERPAQGLL